MAHMRFPPELFFSSKQPTKQCLKEKLAALSKHTKNTWENKHLLEAGKTNVAQQQVKQGSLSPETFLRYLVACGVSGFSLCLYKNIFSEPY